MSHSLELRRFCFDSKSRQVHLLYLQTAIVTISTAHTTQLVVSFLSLLVFFVFCLFFVLFASFWGVLTFPCEVFKYTSVVHTIYSIRVVIASFLVCSMARIFYISVSGRLSCRKCSKCFSVYQLSAQCDIPQCKYKCTTRKHNRLNVVHSSNAVAFSSLVTIILCLFIPFYGIRQRMQQTHHGGTD